MENSNLYKTFIIVNPTAGDGQAEKRWKNFEKNLIKNKILYHVVITEYKNHATKLVSDAILSGYKRIGVFSGDGTLNEVIQGMFKDDQILANNLKLIFFPAGSSCDFEKKFKKRRDLIDRIQADDVFPIDIFKVKCQDSSGKNINRYIINNSSIGIISLANEKFNSVFGLTKKIKQMNVDAGAIICGLQAITQFSPFNAIMKLDGKNIPLKRLSNVSVFKTAHFGGDMSYGIETEQDDGQLSVVWIDGTSKLGLAALMPSLFTGTILKNKQTHYQTCHEFELSTEDAVIVETDGENIGVPPVKYTILPQALQVII
jgi:diacylglycerol kinase family enzyme